MTDDKIYKFFSKVLSVLHIEIKPKVLSLLVQIFKFVIVGGIATLIDWIIYYILCNTFHINPLISNILSFIISSIYNFILSIKWVFNVNEKRTKKRVFINFMIFSLLGLLLSEILLWFFISTVNLDELLSKIVATLIVMVFNFVTRKIFIE